MATCGIRLVMKDVRDAMADILDHTTPAGYAADAPRTRQKTDWELSIFRFESGKNFYLIVYLVID
jgi:DNA-binding IscR family transcriptional regulator